MMTLQPAGASGVLLKSKGPWNWAQAESFGWILDCRGMLRVRTVCGTSESHPVAGKSSSHPWSADRKCSLKVCVPLSAGLLR